MTDEPGGVDESKRSTLRRFAVLGAASPLVGFSVDSTSETPEALVGYLATTPGAHFSKIRDDLQLGTGETQHHLRRLESDGAIESRRDGDYLRFFPAGGFSEYEQIALGYLRRVTPRGMLIELLRDPSQSAGALATELGVTSASVSRHAAALEAAGILDRSAGYEVVRPAVILMLIVQYADSFGREAVALARDADELVSYDG